MKSIPTPVRALQPGDVLPDPEGSPACFVVLDLAHLEPGPVGVQLGRLGELPAHLDRVATVAWQADALVDVKVPHVPVVHFDRVAARPDGTFQHSYRGQRVPAPGSTVGIPPRLAQQLVRTAAGACVPEGVARALLHQAELLEQLFGLHDVLDVAYVADWLRAVAGVAPKHEGATSTRAAELEARRMLALSMLEDVERFALVGQGARVTIQHDEVTVEGYQLDVAPARPCQVAECVASASASTAPLCTEHGAEFGAWLQRAGAGR